MSFPRYPKYKESGNPWMGVIPENWDMLRFQRVVDVAEGQVDPASSEMSALPLIAPNHIESATGRLLALESAESQAAESGKYLCEPGDVLYSKIRPGLRKTCVAPIRCLCSADMYPLRPRPLLNNEFLMWQLLSEQFSAFAVLESDRVAMPKINRESLKDVLLAVPPIGEQQRIAIFLGRETSKIDALVAEQERLIELLKEKRQAVISHAVTKGLNPNAPMKDSGIEWLGQIPAHWQLVRFKQVVSAIGQGWSPQCEAVPADLETEFGVLKVGCVNGGDFDPSENKLLPHDLKAPQELSLEKGDLLVSRANTRELVGSAAVVDRAYPRLLLCDKLYRIRAIQSLAEPLFLCRFLGSAAVRGQIELSATGASSSMLNIAQSAVLDLPLPLAPIDEQRVVSRAIAESLRETDELIQQAVSAIGLLTERRGALVTAAVTGQIDVREASKGAAA
ncbi:MAG: restriction endonuclease subunit S [Archangium sp.]|nr:restriction endonuclease subunit S [Archangium sp.]